MIVMILLIIAALTTGFVYAGNKKSSNEILTEEQCFLAGGEVRNTLGTDGKCADAEKYLGAVDGLRCPCICCQP